MQSTLSCSVLRNFNESECNSAVFLSLIILYLVSPKLKKKKKVILTFPLKQSLNLDLS